LVELLAALTPQLGDAEIAKRVRRVVGRFVGPRFEHPRSALVSRTRADEAGKYWAEHLVRALNGCTAMPAP